MSGVDAAPQPLLDRLRGVELPTLGHTLEEGFCDPGLVRLADGTRMAGPARTVHLTSPDAYAVNRAILALRAGEVLVIRVDGGRHAPVGAVTAAALVARGAAGVVVDGPVTDRQALSALADRLPVYSRGLTARTTKRTGELTVDALDRPVTVGGVTVHSGDLVAGDEHGVLVLPPQGPPESLLEAALASDRAEPELLRRIEAGEPLEGLLPTAPAPTHD